MTVRGIVITLASIAALWFAVMAGEYSSVDLYRQRQHRDLVTRQVDSLQRIVDSLNRYEKAVRTDPLVQERIAREEFGMVRGNKELLYRFAEPDTTKP